MKEQELTRFVQSRNAFFIMLCVSFVATILAFHFGEIIAVTGNDGFGLNSSNEWIAGRELSLYVNLALNGAMAFLLIYMNRRYNVLRTVSPLFAGLFLIMQGAQPSVMGQLYDGTTVCLLVLLAAIQLFSTFQRPQRTRRIFLIFCILAFGALTDYSYLAYMLAFLIGCLQMQCMSLRGILAILLGVITPLWILIGFGIINPFEFRLPVFVSIFEALDNNELAQVIIYTGTTLIIGIIAGASNIIRIYNYNARTRAYNGFWIVLSITTVALLLVDYYHLLIYIPMLNCCTAIQIGHFFAINQMKRGYFIVVCLLMIYSGLYLWNLVI